MPVHAGPTSSTVSQIIDRARTVVKHVQKDLFIGGEWTSGRSTGCLDVVDPASGRSLAMIAAGTVEDGLDAVAAAASALPGWADTAPRQRAEVLRRAWELMMRDTEDLALLMVLENGKTLTDARSEVTYAAEFFRWFAEEAVRMTGSLQRAPSGANRIVTELQPVGVSVLVTPWNFPAAMATRKIAPALAAGCSVVLKPASETPLTALAIASLLTEAGVPPGVVNVICTDHAGPVVAAMLDDPRVRKLSFTGSTEVGRVLLATAARTVVSCSMELGGNAPFVVFDDADIEAAVDGAMLAKMRNGGEACTAANRFYVQRAVVEEFAARFAERMAGLSIGSGLDPGVDLGPLITEQAREKVQCLVDATVATGAQVVTGATVPARPGYFYSPTVLVGVPAKALVLREEIFGPVAPIVEFDDEEEAVAAANDTEYGLVSYVYTGNLARGLRVAEAIDSGMVGVNQGIVSDPAAPFGGTKQSGIGREGAHEGLLEFTETKYIAVDW